MFSGCQESRENRHGDIIYHVKPAKGITRVLYINQNIVKSQIVAQLQNTNVMVYFVSQMVGYVLSIGLKRILDTVRKDTYASNVGKK